MSTSSRYVLLALLGGVFFLGAVYLVLQFKSISSAQDSSIENTITVPQRKDPLVYESTAYGVSASLVEGWSIDIAGDAEDPQDTARVVHVSFVNVSELEDVSLDEWVGLGDGYGWTVDTFEEDRERVATQETAPTISQNILGPIVTLDNGYRAKVYMGGHEGTTLLKSYELYVGDVRVRLAVSPGSFSEFGDAAANTTVIDNSAIDDTAPLEIQQLFSEFDQIVHSFDFSELEYVPVVVGQ